MTASERARLLMADLRLQATLAAVYPTPMHQQGEARSAEALLAYVARLEARDAAAKRLIDSPDNWGPHTDQLIEALAALDRTGDETE